LPNFNCGANERIQLSTRETRNSLTQTKKREIGEKEKKQNKTKQKQKQRRRAQRRPWFVRNKLSGEEKFATKGKMEEGEEVSPSRQNPTLKQPTNKKKGKNSQVVENT